MKFLFLSLMLFSGIANASSKELAFKDFKIRITQNVKKDGTIDALVKVFKGDQDVATREFKSIRPLEGPAGLFIAKTQPLSNLFFVGKEGDFDNILLFVNSNGEINELPWGQIERDDEYIIAVRTLKNQAAQYAVADIEKQRILYRVGNTEKKKYLKEGFGYRAFSKGKYYFLRGESQGDKSKNAEVDYLSISSKQKWLIDQTARWGQEMDKEAVALKALYPGSVLENFEALN